MCPPQGADQVNSFRMHGRVRKTRYSFTCWDTRGLLSFGRVCVKTLTQVQPPRSPRPTRMTPFWLLRCVRYTRNRRGRLCLSRRRTSIPLSVSVNVTHANDICVSMHGGCSGGDGRSYRPLCLPVFPFVGWQQLAWSEQSKRAWQKIPQYPAFKNAGGQRTQKQVR